MNDNDTGYAEPRLNGECFMCKCELWEGTTYYTIDNEKYCFKCALHKITDNMIVDNEHDVLFEYAHRMMYFDINEGGVYDGAVEPDYDGVDIYHDHDIDRYKLT